MRFTKMHGCGNDYVFVDGFRDELPIDPTAAAIRVSDRHAGVGSDGLILICPSSVADAEMRMYNADGTESQMCGNGIRCVAKYLFDHGIVDRDQVEIVTGAGVLTLKLFVEHGRVDRVCVNMGQPILVAEQIPTTLPGNPEAGHVVNQTLQIGGVSVRVTSVSMGNPHCVVFTDELNIDPDSTSEMDCIVSTLGPQIELAPEFPERVNVEFVTVLSRDAVRQRTWERGSGETLACGTGASAVCVAGVLTGRTNRQMTCHLTGGDLLLEWNEEENAVYMTGPAVEVFSGEFAL